MNPWEMNWDKSPKVSFDAALSAEGVSGRLADVARSIYQQESGSGSNTKTSNAGAVGGMQIIPATFQRVADPGWDINNPEHNLRAGIRYIKRLEPLAGGDPALIAAGYYGGEGAIPKARQGVAISDPRNPGAPTTLQYGQQVAARVGSATSGPKPWEMTWEKPPQAVPEKPQTPTGTFLQNVGAGTGKAFVDLARGAKQLLDVPAQALERAINPSGSISTALGMPTAAQSAAATQADVNQSRQLDAPLMATGGGVTGNIIGNVVPSLLIPGVGTYAGAAGAGATLGALQPTVEGESRVKNTAIGAGAGLVGQGIGNWISSSLSNRLAAATSQANTKAAQNATRDAALSAGRAEGYVVPPRMVQEQGTLRGVLEAFGGKIKTEQLASNKNQTVTNALARRALGLPDDAPLTRDTLNNVRSAASVKYEDLRSVGNIVADQQYKNDLQFLTRKYQGASKDFPELAKNEIEQIANSINKNSFSADAAVDALKILRERATDAYAAGNKTVGSAYRGASDAMENVIDRNLAKTGNTQLLNEFREARQLIAKSYSVESALEAGGNVSARKLGSQFTRGKPLTGDLRTAGEFGATFPKATQTTANVEPISVLDTAMFGGLAAGGAGPAALLPFARPMARNVVLSPRYQALSATPNYDTSRLLRSSATVSPILERLLPGASASGTLGYIE